MLCLFHKPLPNSFQIWSARFSHSRWATGAHTLTTTAGSQSNLLQQNYACDLPMVDYVLSFCFHPNKNYLLYFIVYVLSYTP